MSEEGVGNIISHIEAEADKKINEIIMEAQTEIDKIKNAAEEKAGIEAGKILAEGKRAAYLERQRMIAEAKIDVRRKRMDVQEQAIVDSFEEAKKVLVELAEKGERDNYKYKDILIGLIVSAAEVVAGSKLELVLNERDSSRLTMEELKELAELIKKNSGKDVSLVLAKKPNQFLGGVVVRDMENQVEVDNTLENKLNRLKEDIRVDIAKILFGDRL